MLRDNIVINVVAVCSERLTAITTLAFSALTLLVMLVAR